MKRIAIDFGSGVTKIYMPGCGVVLMEATCIAVEEYEEKGVRQLSIKAYGDKAKALSGRTAVNTHIVNPVDDGDIINENLAAHLLGYFLEKVEISFRAAKHTEAIFILPCGVKPEVKEKYVRLAQECGIAASYFTLAPFAAVLGSNVTLSESTPVFALDIGHSLANIAAFSQDGIISGLNINLGGGNIDARIIDYVAENFNLKIGVRTAEKLKNTVGSMLPDDNKMIVVDGREIKTGVPASVAVYSYHLYNIISEFIDKILEYVSLVLAKLPAEVASSVVHGGIYLTGGLLKMDGLAEYIEKKLSVSVNLPEEPQLAPVIGGGVILSNDELLERLATVEE